MAHDHYVAKTCLKHFGDPAAGGMLRAYRKSDRAEFPCWPRNVCREWEGDLNRAWLQEPALLGQYRKMFEPRWNVAIGTLLSGSPSADDRFVVAGLIANLMTCTPAWRRVGAEAYNDNARGFLVFSKRMQEKRGGNPTLPTDAIAAMERGEIGLEHDAEFVKAEYTRQLMQHAWFIYHQDWEIIENNTCVPYVTSDNPVGLIPCDDIRRPPIRLVALTPRLGFAFRATNTQPPPFDPGGTGPRGKIQWRASDEDGARMFNDVTAKCAEDLVLSSGKSEEVAAMVARCARFRVQAE